MSSGDHQKQTPLSEKKEDVYNITRHDFDAKRRERTSTARKIYDDILDQCLISCTKAFNQGKSHITIKIPQTISSLKYGEASKHYDPKICVVYTIEQLKARAFDYEFRKPNHLKILWETESLDLTNEDISVIDNILDREHSKTMGKLNGGRDAKQLSSIASQSREAALPLSSTESSAAKQLSSDGVNNSDLARYLSGNDYANYLARINIEHMLAPTSSSQRGLNKGEK